MTAEIYQMLKCRLPLFKQKLGSVRKNSVTLYNFGIMTACTESQRLVDLEPRRRSRKRTASQLESRCLLTNRVQCALHIMRTHYHLSYVLWWTPFR